MIITFGMIGAWQQNTETPPPSSPPPGLSSDRMCIVLSFFLSIYFMVRSRLICAIFIIVPANRQTECCCIKHWVNRHRHMTDRCWFYLCPHENDYFTAIVAFFVCVGVLLFFWVFFGFFAHFRLLFSSILFVFCTAYSLVCDPRLAAVATMSTILLFSGP